MSSHMTDTRACQFTNVPVVTMNGTAKERGHHCSPSASDGPDAEASARALSCRKQSRLTPAVLKYDVFSLLISAVVL